MCASKSEGGSESERGRSARRPDHIHLWPLPTDGQREGGTGDADGYLGRRRRLRRVAHALPCLSQSRLDNDNTLRFLNLMCTDFMSKA